MKQHPSSFSEPDDSLKMSVEKIEMADERAISAAGRDYAGTAAKTDPVEIKLVRKLDWRIMVWQARGSIDTDIC